MRSEDGLFHVFPIATLNQGLTQLCELAAGEPDANGLYPPDTFNGRVQARLKELAQLRQNFAEHSKDKDGL